MKTIASAFSFVFLFAVISFSATATGTLNQGDETVVFSFNTLKGNKTLTVSMSRDGSAIVYRFGKKSKIELEYPKDKKDSWSKFRYSYYLRGGGAENAGLDLNHLSFTIGDYAYQVYQEYSAEDGSTSCGVRIKNSKTGKTTEISGDPKSMSGSLIQLRDNENIESETE